MGIKNSEREIITESFRRFDYEVWISNPPGDEGRVRIRLADGESVNVEIAAALEIAKNAKDIDDLWNRLNDKSY